MNHAIFKYVLAFLLPLALAYLLTPVAKRVGKLCGLMDVPGERRIHTRTVPRSGGLAVIAAFFAALWVVMHHPELPGQHDAMEDTWWVGLGLPALILLIVGVADDGKGLRPVFKLGGQVVAVFTACLLGIQIDGIAGIHFAPWLSLVLSAGFMLAAINAFNLIDGMDGLAAGLGAIGAFGMAGYLALTGKPLEALIPLMLSGACLGFLRYNFNPASIFLGDTGSMFIGFILAAIAIETSSEKAALASVGLPILAFGVPFFDTLLAIWRRSVRSALAPGSARVFGADQEHLHHRLARRGLTQRRIALTLYATSALVIGIGLLSLVSHSYRPVLFLIAFFAAAYIGLTQLVRPELADSGSMIVKNLRLPARKMRFGLLLPYFDIATLAGSTAACWMALTHFGMVDLPVDQFLLKEAPVTIGLPFLLLVMTRNYKQVWSRTRSLDFFTTSLVLLAGLLIAWASTAGAASNTMIYLLTVVAVSSATAVPAVLLIRALPRLAQDYTHWAHLRHTDDGEPQPRMLICGAGYAYTLMMRSESYDLNQIQQCCVIVGLVDDNPDLKGRIVFGQNVVGTFKNIEELVVKHKVTRLLISIQDLPAEKEGLLRSLADQHGLELQYWRMKITDDEFSDSKKTNA